MRPSPASWRPKVRTHSAPPASQPTLTATSTRRPPGSATRSPTSPRTPRKEGTQTMSEGTSFEETGAAVSVAEDPALGLDRRAKTEILAASLLALFLGALDQTI